MKKSQKTTIRLGLTAAILIVAILSLSLISSADSIENDTNIKLTTINETVTVSNYSVNETIPLVELPGKWILGFFGTLIFAAFVGVLWAGYHKNQDLDQGEMRRTIAGTLIVGFVLLLLLSLGYKFASDTVLIAYIEMTGLVVGYYFGSRALAKQKEEASGKMSIENVYFDPNDSKKITISIRNGSDASITVDKIYVNGDDQNKDRDIQIESQKSKKETIKLDNSWIPGHEYAIKVATKEGKTDEKIKSAK